MVTINAHLFNSNFLVANSNSSFYSRWSLSHSLTHVILQRLRQRTGRPVWVRKIVKGWKGYYILWGSVYKRPQRPFKNDSFATVFRPCLYTCKSLLNSILWVELFTQSLYNGETIEEDNLIPSFQGFLLSPSDKTEGEEFTEFELLEKTLFPEGDVKLQMFHSVCFVFYSRSGRWQVRSGSWWWDLIFNYTHYLRNNILSSSIPINFKKFLRKSTRRWPVPWSHHFRLSGEYELDSK